MYRFLEDMGLSGFPTRSYIKAPTREELSEKLFDVIWYKDLSFFTGYLRKIFDIDKKGMDQKTLRTRMGLSKVLSRLRNEEGLSPLHAAAELGNDDLCSYILHQKVNVDLKISIGDKQGVTPLHIASQYGNWMTIELLLDKGANVHAKRSDGFTPLHGAVAAGKEDNLRFLISKGANVNVHGSPLVKAIATRRYDIVEILLQNGANPNYCPYNGYTPLVYCILKNHPRAMELLLEAHADPNYGGVRYHPYRLAKREERWAMVLQLFHAGAETDVMEEEDLQKEENCVDLATNLATKAIRDEQYGIALYYCSLAMKMNPDNPDYHLVSGRSICWSFLGNVPAALRDGVDLIQRFHKYAKGHRRIGDAWWSVREYGRAVDAYAQALMFDRKHQEEKNLFERYQKAKAAQNSKR